MIRDLLSQHQQPEWSIGVALLYLGGGVICLHWLAVVGRTRRQRQAVPPATAHLTFVVASLILLISIPLILGSW